MGGVRTALYNYLFAKQRQGDFILRIEDTDSNRFVPGAEEYIIEALKWCGIVPDEGVDSDGRVVETPSERHPHAPYRQSQRRGIYRKYAEQLIANGYAYYAFDSSEDLEAARAAAEGRGETFTYNQKSRLSLCNSLTLSPDSAKAEGDRQLDHPLQDAGEYRRRNGRHDPRTHRGQYRYPRRQGPVETCRRTAYIPSGKHRG